MIHLSTKPLTRLGRLVILFMAIMGQLTMIAWLATFAERSSFIFTYEVKPSLRAAAWHIRHGDAVTYDGHRFHLPASWYPEPDSHTGDLDLRYVPFGTLSLDGIHLKSGQKLNGQNLQQLFAKNANFLNERSNVPHEWRLETLQGRKLTFYCMASDQDPTHILNCQAADSDLRAVALTGAKSHIAALNILETSE